MHTNSLRCNLLFNPVESMTALGCPSPTLVFLEQLVQGVHWEAVVIVNQSEKAAKLGLVGRFRCTADGHNLGISLVKAFFTHDVPAVFNGLLEELTLLRIHS